MIPGGEGFTVLFLNQLCYFHRGHKRKHDEAKEEEEEKKDDEEEGSADESSKDSNEEGGDSSSEADEMAAALEAELNDFMWRDSVTGKGREKSAPTTGT